MENKKSVLFIGPAFFGYEVSIKQAIEANGYHVDFFDERTSNHSILKAVFRVKKSLLNNVIARYYKDILQQIKDRKYDHFLLIKGEVVPAWFIIEFQKINPGAKLIYYTYDSINNNNKNSVYILKHFDACYSFDFEDVKKYPELKLKNLFYTDEFVNRGEQAEKKYSISFVGTLHSNRHKTIKTLFSNFENTYTFYFSPAKWFFYLDKKLKKDHKDIKWTDVSFDKLSKQQVADIFRTSASVLDIQRFGQTGLTMRTFEVLAADSILITTNAYVKEADFYDPDRIVVLSDMQSEQEILEIKQKIEVNKSGTMAHDIFDKYYVNNWIKEFFE